MKRMLELKTIKDIRTMTDPYRMEIIRVFHNYSPDAITVKDVAREMDEPHGKVYYHVKKMIDIGAIELIKTEKINGIIAKYYKLAFDEMSVQHKNDQLKEPQDERVKAYTKMISNLFDDHKNKFVEFLNSENLDEREFKAGEKESIVRESELYFDEADYKNFKDELEALVDRYSEKVEDETHFKKIFFGSVYSTAEK